MNTNKNPIDLGYFREGAGLSIDDSQRLGHSDFNFYGLRFSVGVYLSRTPGFEVRLPDGCRFESDPESIKADIVLSDEFKNHMEEVVLADFRDAQRL